MLINIQGQAVTWPLTIDGVQYAPDIEQRYSSAELAALGLSVAPPVTIASPPPLTLSQQQQAYSDQIDAQRDLRLYGGFVVPGAASSALAGKVLQTRTSDQTNWLTSQAAYLAAVSAGEGDTVAAAFRCAQNITTVVSYAEGLRVLLAMAAWGASVFGHSWSLKDQVLACTTADQLRAVQITQGWPSSAYDRTANSAT